MQELRTEDRFVKFAKDAKELWVILGFEANKTDFKSIRVRRIKKTDDEQQQDKSKTYPITKYRAAIYFHVLDRMIGR